MATGSLVALGIAVSLWGATSVAVAVPLVGVWFALTVVKVGPERLVAGSMMAAAFVAPMNGVRPLPGLALIDVLLMGAALPLAYVALLHRDRRPVTGVAPFLLGTALIAIGGTLGTFFAPNRAASLANLLRFLTAITGPLALLWIWRPDVRRLRAIAGWWLAGAVVSATVSLISAQRLGGRAAGLTTHANHLALVSALAAGIALALASSSTASRRWLAGLAFATVSLAVLVSGSRSGLLAWTVTNALVIARDRPLRQSLRRRFLPILAALGLLTVLLLATGGIDIGRHNAIRRTLGDVTSETSDRDRAPLLQAGVETITTHPLTGNGFGLALQAHNIYVQVTAGGGLLGLTGFLLLATTTVREGFRPQRLERDAFLATAFAAGYIGYLAAGFFQNVLWDRYLWLHVAIVMWLGAAARTDAPAVKQCA